MSDLPPLTPKDVYGPRLPERVADLEAKVARLEWLLQFTGGDPNFLVERRSSPEGRERLAAIRRGEAA